MSYLVYTCCLYRRMIRRSNVLFATWDSLSFVCSYPISHSYVRTYVLCRYLYAGRAYRAPRISYSAYFRTSIFVVKKVVVVIVVVVVKCCLQSSSLHIYIIRWTQPTVHPRSSAIVILSTDGSRQSTATQNTRTQNTTHIRINSIPWQQRCRLTRLAVYY